MANTRGRSMCRRDNDPPKEGDYGCLNFMKTLPDMIICFKRALGFKLYVRQKCTK